MAKHTIIGVAQMILSALTGIPVPNKKHIAVRVRPEVEQALRGGHPWLYGDAITSISRVGVPGDVAVVFDRKKRFLAAGLYDPTSPIRVRLLVHGRPQKIAAALFAARLEAAARIRAPLEDNETTAYRLVHGPNDQMAGLVIDRYEQTLVVRLDTLAWIPHLNSLLAVLAEQLAPDHIVLRLSRKLQKGEAALYGLQDGQSLSGSAPEVVRFLENGLSFEADVVRGQKTGFFLDQRENRQRVEELASSRKVLNTFAYSGAFSVYAARGGAAEVLSLDLNKQALESAQRHFEMNSAFPGVRTASHEVLQGDAFKLLSDLAERGQDYDMVILDPPAFARRSSEIDGALRAYGRLTELGLSLLAPGGILVSSSCSSRVTAGMFFDTVSQTASRQGRPLQEIERSGHALDHPVGFREGAYLKTLFASAP